MNMAEKILVPSYNKEQKETLYKRVMEEDIMSLLPELRKDYRWKLKVSREETLVFELELQKNILGFWQRTVSYSVSMDNLKTYGSVENCLKNLAEDLLNMEEERVEKNRVKKYDWVDGVFE